MREESYFLGLIAPTSLSIFICSFFVCVISYVNRQMQKTQQGNLSLSGEFDSEAGTDRRGAFAQQSRGKVCLLLLLFHISRVSKNHSRCVKNVGHRVDKKISP